MPRPIKQGKNIEVSKTIVENGKDKNFHMASMSACTDHYEIGFQISGDSHTYSTESEWDILSGYVGTIPLGLPHQTFSTSNAKREGILVKYSFTVADYIKAEISSAAFNRFYNEKYHILAQKNLNIVRNIFEQMLTEYNKNSIHTESKLKALLTYLIIYIIEHQLPKDEKYVSHKDSNKNINEVMRYIEANYDNEININTICKSFGFSPSHFSRLFKQTTGESFSKYLSKVRFEHAILLLSTTKKSIDDIAYECGFNSVSYFSYAFKKNFHLSPLQYRTQTNI